MAEKERQEKQGEIKMGLNSKRKPKLNFYLLLNVFKCQWMYETKTQIRVQINCEKQGVVYL